MPTINETLKQLEAQRNLAQKELAGLEAAINALKPLVADVPVSVAVKTVAPVAAAVPAKKNKMSAAGRANVQATMKARWAKYRAEKLLKVVPASTPAKTVKPAVPAKKNKMSAAGRANVLAGVRARFARIKAEQAKAKK